MKRSQIYKKNSFILISGQWFSRSFSPVIAVDGRYESQWLQIHITGIVDKILYKAVLFCRSSRKLYKVVTTADKSKLLIKERVDEWKIK